MVSREPKDDKCGARVKNIPEDWDDDAVGYCEHPAGFRCDDPDANRCYLHGGATPSVNENNTHAEKHGIHTERQRYYEKRPGDQQLWIDAVVESILDDIPENEPSFYKVQMARNIAIDMHKLRNANEYIDEKGVVHRDKTVGYTDDGKPIKQDEENTINIAYDRLNRTLTKQLKQLGTLDDPESKKAESQDNIADELSALREARDS